MKLLAACTSIVTVASIVTVLLLVLCLYKLDAMQNSERKGSGQIVRAGNCETERWVDESLESWGARHREALREFRQDQVEAGDE